jgi:RNA-directed DNA polymerase
MKKSHESGVATHIGPESCGAACKGSIEALTGDRAGRVFSRERISLRDADAVGVCGRPHRVHRYREVYQSPARSETPSTHGNTSRGNREIPSPPWAAVALGRVGKSKDARR